MGKKVVLMILDGWGHGDGSKSDGIANADTPFVDSLYRDYPCSRLLTDGENVGLPDGQMGNSEVGHLNIGAGRVVCQDLLKINNAIGNGTFDPKNIVKDALKSAREREANVHIMGLLSDGGVHSSQEHLYAICDLVQEAGVENAFIHAFTDGRDTDPHGALEYVKKLQNLVSSSRIKLASIVGRYYAMDRDKRWERIAHSYNALCSDGGDEFASVEVGIRSSYDDKISDEFIVPFRIQGV